MARPGSIGPWRRALQASAGLAVFLTPFVRVGGESCLRLDLPTRSLVLLGRHHPLEEMHLLLPLAATGVLVFLLATMTLGRVWCGFACPQTTLCDLTETLARRLGARPRGRGTSGGRRALLHAGVAALSLLAGANLAWYVLSPYEFFPRLLAGALPGPAAALFAAGAAAAYADLAFVGRSFCRAVCPYGRFQAALAEASTLTVGVLPAEAGRCLDCGACARACPTGIDVRRGAQIECLHCGRCVDACRAVMARRGERGLVAYAFGDRGWRGLLNARTALVAAAALAAAAAFAVSAARWAPASLTVRRSAAAERRLASGETAVLFEATLASRSAEAQRLALAASAEGGRALELRGAPTALALAPRERRVLHLALLLPVGRRPEEAVFALRGPGGRTLASVRAPLGPGRRP